MSGLRCRKAAIKLKLSIPVDAVHGPLALPARVSPGRGGRLAHFGSSRPSEAGQLQKYRCYIRNTASSPLLSSSFAIHDNDSYLICDFEERVY